jgi:hypothetical protein
LHSKVTARDFRKASYGSEVGLVGAESSRVVDETAGSKRWCKYTIEDVESEGAALFPVWVKTESDRVEAIVRMNGQPK